MARFSGSKARRHNPVRTLRAELEWHMEAGRCAYCRTPAKPGGRLTREHVIPRARGGRRKDVRIIVPACARCNHERGCRDLIPFLLIRPTRISSLLDYFSTLSVESIREVDIRIFAELYVTLMILGEGGTGLDWSAGETWRMCGGRSLHRRRYATRRALLSVADRFAGGQIRRNDQSGPGCLIPIGQSDRPDDDAHVSIELLIGQLTGILALLWGASADAVEREMRRAAGGASVDGDPRLMWDQSELAGGTPDGASGARRRTRASRVRVDRRRGRGVRRHAGTTPARGRAA